MIIRTAIGITTYRCYSLVASRRIKIVHSSNERCVGRSWHCKTIVHELEKHHDQTKVKPKTGKNQAESSRRRKPNAGPHCSCPAAVVVVAALSRSCSGFHSSCHRCTTSFPSSEPWSFVDGSGSLLVPLPGTRACHAKLYALMAGEDLRLPKHIGRFVAREALCRGGRCCRRRRRRSGCRCWGASFFHDT
jgi:hypothetical protein